MKTAQNTPLDLHAQLKQTQHSDDYFLLLFNHFAERVDNKIQNELYTQLMNRYASVSRTLESTVKQLARSDTLRKQAEKIAMLGNWIIDPKTKIIEWSDTMYTIAGLSRDRAPDLAEYYKRVHPEDISIAQEAGNQLLNGIPPEDLTYRLQMPNGSIKWVHSQHIVEHNPNGEVETIYGTLQDVTTAKLAEQKLQQYNDHLEDLVQQKADEVYASQLATIHALVKLAESRDDDTGEHIERMSKYSRLFAEILHAGSLYAGQVNDAFIRNIAMASPLHDIGKVGIPDHILLKPGKLTPDEFIIMKTHVSIGYETLASVHKSYPGNGYLKMGMDIARCHHEKWDGSGYMQGLRGENIPLAARILSLCDVYDALRSRRVYKEPYSHEKSKEIIRKGSGIHFDPVLVNLFEEHDTDFKQIFDHHSSK